MSAPTVHHMVLQRLPARGDRRVGRSISTVTASTAVPRRGPAGAGHPRPRVDSARWPSTRTRPTTTRRRRSSCPRDASSPDRSRRQSLRRVGSRGPRRLRGRAGAERRRLPGRGLRRRRRRRWPLATLAAPRRDGAVRAALGLDAACGRRRPLRGAPALRRRAQRRSLASSRRSSPTPPEGSRPTSATGRRAAWIVAGATRR